jgi:putative PIN family toxin of toxin-antitoxin system
VKVVLDTNVFVSGVFFGGTPGRVLEAWRDGRVEVILSREIIEEYVRVGEELASRFPGVEPGPALELLAVSTTLVGATLLPAPVSRDPDDDKFLACALAAGADCIVSGDRDLLDLSSYEGVVVMSPRDFVDRFEER